MPDDAVQENKSRFPLKVCIVIAVILILVIPTTVFFFHLNGNSMDFSDSRILIVPTDSMDGEPQDYPVSSIPIHSLIMTRGLSDEQKKELSVGDVITFRQNGMEKVHRIIEVRDNGTVITKGDNAPAADSPVPLSDITGKVAGVSPVVGNILWPVRDFAVKSPILIIIGIILLIIMIYSIVEVVGIIRNKDQDN